MYNVYGNNVTDNIIGETVFNKIINKYIKFKDNAYTPSIIIVSIGYYQQLIKYCLSVNGSYAVQDKTGNFYRFLGLEVRTTTLPDTIEVY